MIPLACTQTVHDALKADAAAWSALPLLGHQHIEADDDGPAEVLVLKNCPHCHSTLCKTLVLDEQRR